MEANNNPNNRQAGETFPQYIARLRRTGAAPKRPKALTAREKRNCYLEMGMVRIPGRTLGAEGSYE